MPGPWIFVDELIYSELGRSAFSGFGIRSVSVDGYGNVYPLLIAPAYAVFADLVHAYSAVKVTNAIVMSLTAIPVYFMARMLAGRRWSLAAGLLAVLVPGMGYTGMVMTENAFYPAFAVTALFCILAIQRQRVAYQVLAFAGGILCFEVRAQGAVVVAAYLVAVLLFIVLEAGAAVSGNRLPALRREVAAFWPTWGIAILGGAVALAMMQARGRSLSSLLGAYSITADDRSRYQLKPIADWFVLHVAELDLWLGVVPVVALLVLAGIACSRTGTRAERAFIAFAIPAILAMAVVVAAFVVFANVGRIEDRNLFYVGIFPLIAMCWWGERRLVRQQPRWTMLALVIAAVLPMIIPFGSLLNQSAVSDTFGLFIPFAINSRLLDATMTTWLVAAGTIVAAALVVFVPERRSAFVIIVVASFFLATGIAVDRRTDKASAAAVSISDPQNWVDEAVGADTGVKVVYPGGTDPMRIWQAEFFNRSVGDVLTIGTPLAGGLPDTVVNIRADGHLVDRNGFPIEAEYVLTDSLTGVVGGELAADRAHGMRLVKVGGPVRVYSTATGVYGDGWSTADIVYTRYRCTGGTVALEASENASIHPSPVTVTPFVGELALPSTSVDATVGSVQVPATLTPVDGVCQVRFHVDPVVTPADAISSADTRPLGVIVRGFSYTPPN